MSCTIDYKMNKDFLYANIKGDRNIDSIKKATKEICDACLNNRCSKVLVDVRDFTEHIKIFDIFSLASKDLPDIIKGKIKKVAILDKDRSENNQTFF